MCADDSENMYSGGCVYTDANQNNPIDTSLKVFLSNSFHHITVCLNYVWKLVLSRLLNTIDQTGFHRKYISEKCFPVGFFLFLKTILALSKKKKKEKKYYQREHSEKRWPCLPILQPSSFPAQRHGYLILLGESVHLETCCHFTHGRWHVV